MTKKQEMLNEINHWSKTDTDLLCALARFSNTMGGLERLKDGSLINDIHKVLADHELVNKNRLTPKGEKVFEIIYEQKC